MSENRAFEEGEKGKRRETANWMSKETAAGLQRGLVVTLLTSLAGNWDVPSKNNARWKERELSKKERAAYTTSVETGIPDFPFEEKKSKRT